MRVTIADDLKEMKDNFTKEKLPSYLISILAVSIALFHLYTGAFGIFDYLIQRPFHLLTLTALCFCIYPLFGRKDDIRFRIIDIILITLSFSTLLYIFIEHERLMGTVAYVTKPMFLDWVFMIIAIGVVLEATRRAVGSVLPALGLGFVIGGYMLATMQVMPEMGVPKIQSFWWVHAMFITSQGLWGVPTMVSATFIFLFVVLAAFLESTRVGRFLIDFALSIVGTKTGGPGKVAVISSSLFGMVSGSAAANVYGTGVFTIPTMKRFGFTKNFAGAVEVVASTGGQLMPPIMGAGAFVMAAFIGIPYIQIAAAALIPAILYYVAAFWAVHGEARKKGLTGLPPEQVRPFKTMMKEELGMFITFVIPIGYLVYLLMTGTSLYTAVFYSIIVLLVVSTLRTESRLTAKNAWGALSKASRNATMIAMACGVASVIVGVLNVTGWGVTFSTMLVKFAMGNPYILLISAALFSILLGFGMPTTAAYILAAALIAPALITAGFEKFPAHMYVFTFAIYSTITPPVALASYAAAGISEGDPIRTATTAMKMVLPSFIIPVRFVLFPAILLMGTPLEILFDFLALLIAVIAIEASAFSWPVDLLPSRIILAIGALLVILPLGEALLPFSRLFMDLAGIAVITAGAVIEITGRKAKEIITD